ncbi:hypothetical protein [Sphingomonas aerophila]|uniref:Uncharacterized protein n=1 Tax=Sphingomonas aerophila TaxID=1344948 RepID=A0A7W9BHB2_9SPHN|nr:hypothetical protein [Sphingomonas aerophila]MBB5717028.1 hypothetical protein [Sphingomonas aerophila]
MEHCIAHACGHEQAHYIPGSPAQQDRKARWLRTTKCRTCFVDDKRSEEAEAAARNATAIAHLGLPELVGSDRQVSWATTIRMKRLAAILATSSINGADSHQACIAVTDAKWWIDHRDLTDIDLIAKGRLHVNAPDATIAGAALTRMATIA